jgi:5-methyltetrahydrofolate--homocysteine methyltransferase
MREELIKAVGDLEEERALEIVEAELDLGADPLELLADAREGMSFVGQQFESGDYFLSDLVMSGELFKQIAGMISSRLGARQRVEPKGKIVMATVKGDIHDIGKDIVVSLLQGASYEVLDLGVDVPAEWIVEGARTSGASIVGLSGLLTIAFDPMKETIEALRQQCPSVKIMIGGAPVTESVRVYVGADALGKDAQSAVAIADRWVAEEREDG